MSSGLTSQVGFARETTYGTIVTPTNFLEFDSETLSLDQNYQDGQGLRVGRTFESAARMRATTRQAGGVVNLDVPTKGFGAVLDLMHGATVTPAQQGGTTAYLQTHNIGNSLPTKFVTIQTNKPMVTGEKKVTYHGCVLREAGFSIDTAGVLKTALTFDAQDESTPSGGLATASYPSGFTTWVGTGVSLTAAGVEVAVCRSINFTWSQPFRTDRFFLNTTGLKLQPIPNGFATVTGTMDLEWYDSTHYDLFRAGTKLALVLTLTNDVISGAYSEQIRFSMAAVQFRGSSPQVGGPDVLDLSVPFKAGHPGSTAPLVVTYQSTDTTI